MDNLNITVTKCIYCLFENYVCLNLDAWKNILLVWPPSADQLDFMRRGKKM